MTGLKALLPLRVPELGPSLGRLVAVAQGSSGEPWLDSVRHKLATRIIECAGEARRLAANGERSATISAIGPEIWKQVWDEAVGSATDQLVARLDTHMIAEATAVGMGRRRRVQLCFAPHEKRALMARLGAAGAPLIPVLDELDVHAKRALNATGLEPDAVRNWQDSLSLAARRLESAWLALQGVVQDEVAQRLKVAEQVARWRRPLWPILIAAAVALPAAAWLGLVLGGYVIAPHWLTHVWQTVFRS